MSALSVGTTGLVFVARKSLIWESGIAFGILTIDTPRWYGDEGTAKVIYIKIWGSFAAIIGTLVRREP